MKRYFKLILIAVLAVEFTSCDTFLDVNTDPNNPPHAPYEMVLAPAVVSTASVVGGQYAILGSIWSQHFTQNNTANQYKVIDGYRLTSSDFNSSFNELYSGALNDYNQVIKESEQAKDWNTYLMAVVMQSYTFQVLADLYDKIPFTDALKGTAGNISPRYDDCSVVYDGLVSRIDNALSKDFSASSNRSIGSKDFVFQGDMTKWKQFANTLKLKIYLRQINVRPAVSQAGIAALYSNGASFLTADAKINPFLAEVKKQNPLYGSEVEYLGNSNLRASKTLFDYLNTNSDPRLNKIYSPGTGGHKALAQGDYLASSVTYPNGSLSKGTFAATDAVYFLTEAESYFLQAEALVRYPSLSTTPAKSLYEAGVDAAFRRVSLTTASTFTAALAAYEFKSAGTTEQKIEQIITQKWISCAIAEPIESFFEFNRTLYPSFFTVSVNTAIGPKFPKRLLFVSDERSRNPNTPEQVNIDVKGWWAK